MFHHSFIYCIPSTELHANDNLVNDRETLGVLSAHATIKARKNYSAPGSFYQSFSQFCDRLYDSGWPDDYLSVEDSDVRAACWKFWREHQSLPPWKPSRNPGDDDGGKENEGL